MTLNRKHEPSRYKRAGRVALGIAAAGGALLVVRAIGEQRWSTRHWTHPVGSGEPDFQAASRALLSWDMHRGAGAWVGTDTPPATAGQRMVSAIGVWRLRLPEPCEVLEVVQEADRTVMHYLALPGHAFEGDESFAVHKKPDGKVTFEVTVHSRPSLWLPRLAGPMVPVTQWLFITRCAAVLRKAARGSNSSAGTGQESGAR